MLKAATMLKAVTSDKKKNKVKWIYTDKGGQGSWTNSGLQRGHAFHFPSRRPSYTSNYNVGRNQNPTINARHTQKIKTVKGKWGNSKKTWGQLVALGNFFSPLIEVIASIAQPTLDTFNLSYQPCISWLTVKAEHTKNGCSHHSTIGSQIFPARVGFEKGRTR